MKYEVKPIRQDLKLISVPQFNPDHQIDVKPSVLNLTKMIHVKNDDYEVFLIKNNTPLFEISDYLVFNDAINQDDMIEQVYTWIRTMEIKYYGTEIIDLKQE